MSFNNFKKTVWSAKIQTDLEKELVLANFCNREFEGEARENEYVKIIGASRPTVRTYTPGSSLTAAEQPLDTSILMKIDQYDYTHFAVDNIDEAQSGNAGILAVDMSESAKALAENADAYIGTLAANATYISSSASGNSADEAKTLVDAAFVQLWTNGVRISDELELVIPPWFYSYFKSSLQASLTDNVQLIKTGVVGYYNGAAVKMSTNLYVDSSSDYYIMLRTRKAIAFANGINKVVAYEPESGFSDAVKALHTYGGMIVRPKELYVIKAHNS